MFFLRPQFVRVWQKLPSAPSYACNPSYSRSHRQRSPVPFLYLGLWSMIEKTTIEEKASLSETRPKHGGEGFLVVFWAPFDVLYGGFIFNPTGLWRVAHGSLSAISLLCLDTIALFHVPRLTSALAVPILHSSNARHRKRPGDSGAQTAQKEKVG